MTTTQYGLFGNDKQVKDRQPADPQSQQLEMFSQREIAQFGIEANPLISLSATTRLGWEQPTIVASENVQSSLFDENEQLSALDWLTSLKPHPSLIYEPWPTALCSQPHKVGIEAYLDQQETRRQWDQMERDGIALIASCAVYRSDTDWCAAPYIRMYELMYI